MQTNSEEPNHSKHGQTRGVLGRPFLKWVGGKGQLLSEILPRILSAGPIDTYYEPFLGGAAVFFGLAQSLGHKLPQRYVLSDNSEELINCFKVLRDFPEELISELKKHVHEKSYYYKLRSADRQAEYATWPALARAARIIYLNKTCFNGLYRVNSKGEFNTPFGKYKNPKIADEPNLRNCSELLQQSELQHADFNSILESATNADFVYLDPPYAPLSKTAKFNSYTQDNFPWAKQVELHKLCQEMDKKGMRFLLSNSSIPEILELYREFRIERVLASRAINSKVERRGSVEELLISNF